MALVSPFLFQGQTLSYPVGRIPAPADYSTALEITRATKSSFHVCCLSPGSLTNLVDAEVLPSQLTIKAGVIDAVLGPCAQTGDSTGKGYWTVTARNIAPAFWTYAALFKITTLTATSAALIGGEGTFYIDGATSQLALIGNGTAVLSGITVSANVPYFAAVTGSTSGTLTFVLMNLLNGKAIFSDTSILTFTFPGTTQWAIGNNIATTQVLQGYIAGAFFTNLRIPIGMLQQLTLDPWSIWYQRRLDLRVGAAAAAFKAAWALNRNFINQGVAT